jgi:hypothetical protein
VTNEQSRPGAISRKQLDVAGGVIFVILAVVALLLGLKLKSLSDFAHDNVHAQLAAQKIAFPPKGSEALDPQEFPDLQRYAGEAVDNGQKAKAYANGFIARHLAGIADGKTYAEVSGAAQQAPDNQELQQQAQTLFRGETLRGLLLTTYAFDKMGDEGQFMAVLSFIAAGLLLLLGMGGLWHGWRLARAERAAQ